MGQRERRQRGHDGVHGGGGGGGGSCDGCDDCDPDVDSAMTWRSLDWYKLLEAEAEAVAKLCGQW